MKVIATMLNTALISIEIFFIANTEFPNGIEDLLVCLALFAAPISSLLALLVQPGGRVMWVYI